MESRLDRYEPLSLAKRAGSDELDENSQLCLSRIGQLDPDGDTILDVKDEQGRSLKLKASSKTLTLASPVFERLFHGEFAEARQNSVDNMLCITLREDDVHAMEVILMVLHHIHCHDLNLSFQDLATIAIHTDKYDCSTVLKPWILYCVGNVCSKDHVPLDYGFRLLIMTELKDSLKFREAWEEAAKVLRPADILEWQDHSILKLLPNWIPERLSAQIEHLSTEICTMIQESDNSLRRQRATYEMDIKECSKCDRDHPGIAKKCHPCNNQQLRLVDCTSERRVSDYFAILRGADLWPAVTKCKGLSLKELTNRLSIASMSTKHRCFARANCPLKLKLEDLHDRARLTGDSVTGHTLEP